MRRLFALLALTSVAAPAAANVPPPRLTLVAREPLRVHGSSFRPREHATVTAVADVRRSRRVVVDAEGRFTVGFAGDVGDPCSALVVRAVGAKGDHAVLVLRPLPQCPPP